MFLNHTPLKPTLIEYGKKAGNMLVTGVLNVKEIVDSLGIKNYITAEEFYSIYCQITPSMLTSELILHKRKQDRIEKIKVVENRLGRKLKSFRE